MEVSTPCVLVPPALGHPLGRAIELKGFRTPQRWSIREWIAHANVPLARVPDKRWAV